MTNVFLDEEQPAQGDEPRNVFLDEQTAEQPQVPPAAGRQNVFLDEASRPAVPPAEDEAERERFIEDRHNRESVMKEQLQYVIDNSKDDKERQQAEKWQRFLGANNILDKDDDWVKRSEARVGSLHKKVADRRGHLAKFRDALVRGYDSTAIMAAQAWLGITDGDNPETQKTMRNLQSVGREWDASRPKATGSVSDIKSAGDVLDFIGEAIGENLYRGAIGTTAAIASGGTATMLGAGAVGASVAAIGGSSLSTLALNTGEAVQDQLDEGVPFSRGWALAQGAGYSVLDGALGVEAGIGKLAVKTGLRAAKDTAVAGLKEVGKMATKKGALKTLAKSVAGEALQEPAQSQVVGRLRRLGQTGSMLRNGETVGEAWMEALDEAAGGAAAALGMGGGGAAISHANARRIVGIHNRVVNAVKQDAAFNELPPEQQLLVARRLMNDCLLETSGVLSEEQKADLRTISEDIDAELGRKDADTATKAANAVLRGFDLVYAKDDFNEAVKEAKESGEFAGRVDWNAMRDSAQDIGEVPGGYRGTRYTDPVTGQSIVRRSDKDGHIVDFIVENRRGLKDSLTGDALHTKSLKKALEACADLDIYNQYRAKKSEAKRQVIKEMFSRMYGERGANLVIADSVASMQDPEMRDKIARAGANAAYDAKNNTVYVLADRMRNLGQLYTDLAHERSHLDIAEHILGRSLEGGATDEEMERLEAGRKERFAETGRGDAESGEEAVAEHASVEQVLKAIRDSSLSLPGAVADYVRQRISKDTGIAASLVSDEDVRSELKFLADGGYLGKSAETRGSVEEDTEADAVAETQAKSATDAAAMTKAEKQRKQAEREAVAAKARGKAERKAAGEEAARVIAQDGGEESVPPIGAAKEKRTDRGAAMESALGAAGEEIGRGREKAAEAREAEDAEKKRLAQEEAARKERVKDRKGDVEAALDEAGAEIGDMAEKRRVVRERAEGVAEQNRREAEERNEAERDAEEAAALAEEERWRPAREAAAQREQDAYDQMMLEFEESRSTKSAKNEGKTTNEAGNGANEAPAQSAETSAEPENAAKTPQSAENESQGGETGGVVRPKAAQNRAEAPAEAPGARSTAETGNDTPAAQNAPEGVSRGAVAMSADDFVAAHSDVDEKGKRWAHRDILTQGEVAPSADAAPKKAKKVKAGDTAGVFRAVGRHASQDNTRKVLMSVHVEDGQLVATDGRRIIVVPAPEGVENGTYSAKNPTEKADLKYPKWQQVVPSLKKDKYAKVGEISNGDATHGRAAFADELRRKVERSRKGDAIGALLRIGDRYLNPQYVKEIVDTMFSLGADKVQVYMSPDYAPVVFKGRSERGEMTGVVMPLRLGNGDAPSEKGTHVRLFSDAGGTRFKRSANADASRVEAAEGVVSLGDMRKLFDRLNNDEQTAQLAEAVFAAAKNAGVDVAVESLLPEQGSDPEDNGGRPFGTSFRGYVKYDLGYLNGDQYDDRHKAETIVHELIHSLTSYAVSAVNGDAEKELPRGLKVNDELKAAVKDLATIFDESRFYLATDQKTSYASTDIHEFIAEFSNKDVRDVLKKRKFWERVVDCIRRIIDGFIRLNSYPADTDKLVNGLDAMSGVLGRFLDNFDRKAFEATKAFDATRKRDRFWQEPQKRGFARIIDGEAANGDSTRFKRGADGLSPEGQRQYDEIVRRYTNPDGTKKRGWMKAPNGKPTKLTERQWVQVRTPAFKEWFGDWEANAVRATWYDIADAKDVLSLAVQDVRGVAPLADKAAIKSAFMKWGEVQNKTDKRKVVFPNASAGRFERVGAVSGALNTLFEQSRRAWSEPDDGRHNNLAAIHHYVAKAQTDDGDVYVHFTIREDKSQSNSVHAATVSSVDVYKTSAGILPGNNLATSSAPFTDDKISYFLGGVKGASKVVDENGEPLVVYHGSLSKDITEFKKDLIGSRYAYDEKGFFFTSSPSLGEDYAHSEFSRDYGKVYPVFISAKNALVVNDEFARQNGLGRKLADMDAIEFWDTYQSFVLEAAQNGSHDGIIIDDGKTQMVVAFSPNQIKSATDNNGDFSGSDYIRFKRSAPVDSPDALFGARASRKAHGLADLTAEESNLAYTDKELYAAGQRVSKDVPHMMGVVSDALTSDRALSLEDTFALTVFLRDRLDALADVHAKMQSGNAASFAAEEEYLSAIVDKASRAVARNNTKLAGLRVARLGVALDTARDTEAWITEEVKSRRVAQGLPAEPSEADAAMIKQHAERLAKLNAENEALRKEIEELRRKAVKRTGEAAIEQSRRRARKDAPRALSAERRAKAEKEFGTTLTDDDSAGFAELDGIFGKGAVFKGGSQSAALTPEMTAAFAKLAKGGFDRAEKMVLKQYPQAASAWREFRLRSEGVGAEELAKLAEPIAPRRRATTRNLAEAREETKRLLDENADDPREQRKAIGRYLRRYRDALINENPDIPTAELNERMAAEATALTGTKHDAVAMLAVSAGVDGYDLETRTDIQRRIAKARHALSLFRQGKVNEAARESGILYDDEATALKDMEDTLRKLVKEKADEIDYLSTFSESNAEAVERVKQLKAELDEANDALRLMRKETSLAEKKRKYAEVLEKRLAEAQRRADALRGEIESEAFKERKSAAEAKVAELKAALSAARRSEDALKRIQDRIAEYERRIADEDYDAQVLRYQANDAYLQSKLALARERRNEARRKLEAERRKRSYREKGVVGKALYGLGGLLGEMKGVVASFDLSSVLRQGGQLSWAHPFLAAKNLGETLKAWKSAEYANNLMAQLRMRPNWQYYEKAGIDFTDWGEGATNKEDVYLLNKFRTITNQKFLKAGVEASERAFSMFLNLMRADVFDAMASGSTFGSAANMNDRQLKSLGRFINIATQRASFEKGGKWEKAIPALNTILWSPRNVASRFQFLYETARLVTGGAAYGDVTMRSLFAKELVRYIGGMGAAAMFLKAVNELLFREPDDPPDETEFDPRSSDFLKVRFGNVRIDLTSGLTPILVFGTRMVGGETKNVRGQVRKSNRYELVGRFLRQKFAPGASLVYDLGIAREDFEKRDIDWGSAWDKEADRISAYRYLAGSFVPLSGVDLVEQAEVGGVPKTLVTGALSILGANVQAFDPYNFKQLKGDYTYFKGLYDKAMDDEERRNLVRLCPMLKRRLGIEVALMRVRELDKMRKDAEKRGQPPPEWLEERIREAKQKAVGVMSGID